MSEVCYTSKPPILYSSDAELFFSGSLSDLLDTIGSFAKHTLFLHYDRPNFDHEYICLIDHELLYFYALIHAVRLIMQTLMDGSVGGLRLPEFCILITAL
jgi:hypothetical protein